MSHLDLARTARLASPPHGPGRPALPRERGQSYRLGHIRSLNPKLPSLFSLTQKTREQIRPAGCVHVRACVRHELHSHMDLTTYQSETHSLGKVGSKQLTVVCTAFEGSLKSGD